MHFTQNIIPTTPKYDGLEKNHKQTKLNKWCIYFPSTVLTQVVIYTLTKDQYATVTT
jgi:hypothetical protein